MSRTAEEPMLDTYLRSYVEDLRWTLEEIDRPGLAAVVEVLARARDDHRQILVIGNGGSAATASHLACDLGKGTVNYGDPAFRRFRVLSLSDNTALMSALGNDISFDDVFTEQLKMLMCERDVVILISASGNSPNLVRAAEYARAGGAITVGLLGFGGGALAGLVDVPLVVSSRNYGISEDFHLIVQHVITQHLRRALAGPPRAVAFLDRDGIINERAAPHEYIESWEQFRLLDGAVPLMRGLAERGYLLMVVTNQQGIGKGRMTAADLRLIHGRMADALADQQVGLAGIFHCPHLEQQGCFCRKPGPGLIYRALNESPFLIDLQQSLMIGDSESDMLAGKAAGLRTLVRVGPADSGGRGAASHVVSTVAEALTVVAPAVAIAS
jgi:D-sedoheptulose 7-phosphate isomerase